MVLIYIFLVIVNPPEIITQPINLNDLPEDEDAIFSVTVSGLNLTYQWKKDGVDIEDLTDTYSGVTTSDLTVLSVDTSDNGNYTVLVHNPTGSMISSSASLRVCE